MPVKSDFKIFQLKNFYILSFLFLYVYTPLVLLPFNVIHIIAVISVFILLTTYQKLFFSILELPELRAFIFLHIVLIIYSWVLDRAVLGNYENLYYLFSTIFEALPIAIFFTILFLVRKINLYGLYDIILFIGLIQVGFVLLTMVFPSLRTWIIASASSQGLEDVYDIVGDFRLYGFARNYTFSMPLFQGLCLIIAYVLGTFKSHKYFFLIPFYVISIAFNARVGLISIAIVVIITLFYRIKKNPTGQILLLAIVGFIFFYGLQIIKFQADNSLSYGVWNWLNDGLTDLGSYQKGEATGNLSYLTDSFWFLPDKQFLIFGTGENIFGRANKSSDVGYVINLYYGGIVFSAMLYWAYFSLLLTYNKKIVIEKVVTICAIILMVIANFKGNSFRLSELTTGLMLLAVFSIVSRKFTIESAKNFARKNVNKQLRPQLLTENVQKTVL